MYINSLAQYCKVGELTISPFPLQRKRWGQRWLEVYEEVSDECSSCMMRVMHVAHSIPVCILCVQMILNKIIQNQIEDPNNSEVRKSLWIM